MSDEHRRDGEQSREERLLHILYYSTWFTPMWVLPMWRSYAGARPWFGPWLKRRLTGCRILGRRP
ncbi:hypothetical protein E1287_37190 [Actinomadura sp. KC06]|uniref:hypothetical protein n=1 Tax=Actinomadura sp. KC06 TaxID=2530369 RepID=UPI0010516624|nr:hypothetical protein [Actinomadura sp. KC06]TDD25592.1 hypothetical protein E1287_37190 [Actinomadura sp. KC06]